MTFKSRDRLAFNVSGRFRYLRQWRRQSVQKKNIRQSFSGAIMCPVRSSHPEVFLGKGVLKTYSRFTGERPYRGVISITLLCNINGITLRHERSPVNLLHIFRKPLLKNNSGGLLLPRLNWCIAGTAFMLRMHLNLKFGIT